MTNRVADYPQQTASPGSSASSRPLIRASDVRGMFQPVEQWITRSPAVALASAFMVGVAIAWWIKRK
jgi:hypothetical protein